MEATINILNLILLIAVIAIFWRLRSVLGMHVDSDPAHRDILKPRSEKSSDAPKEKNPAAALRVVSEGEDARASDGLTAIARADQKFDTAKFLEGSVQAYEIIVLAYAENNVNTLRPLVSDDVFSGFEQAMKAREAQNQVLETSFIKLNPATIYDAQLDGKMARLTVQIESECISVLRDSEGLAIDGSPELVTQNKDLWTFERNIKSRSPKWRLVGTQSL